MARPQAAICAEDESFGIFLTLLAAPDGAQAIRRLSRRLPGLTAETAERMAEPSLVSAIGFGAAAWERLLGAPKPAGLVPFEAISDGPRSAPSTPADIFLHIHSARHYANFALANEVMRQLGPAVRVVEEVHGFRNLGNRDLIGFVDGTENPKGEERAAVALVGSEDPAFAGGSHVSIQRYVTDLDRWQRLAVAEQEGIVGRSKVEDLEMDDEVKPPTAHIARVVIEEDGKELEVVRHSLPYGTTGERGLYFVAYGSSPRPFRLMLERMFRRDQAGHYDHLLDFTRPVTGAAFFMPSEDFLVSL